MKYVKISDLPISTGQPPQPNEQVAVWDGCELRRWVDVGEWERRIRADERTHPKASVDEIKCLRMMLDHAERWIDFRWLGEWGQHGIAKAFVERLAAIDAREGTP